MAGKAGQDDLFEDANSVQYSATARQALLVPGQDAAYTLPSTSPLVRRDRAFDEPELRSSAYGPAQNPPNNGGYPSGTASGNNRFTIPLSCQGFLDPFTLRLQGNIQVQPDVGAGSTLASVNTGFPTVAYSKISLQALIQKLEWYQVDSNYIEQIVEYGYLNTFIGQCLIAPYMAIMTQVAEREFALTKPMGYVMSNIPAGVTSPQAMPFTNGVTVTPPSYNTTAPASLEAWSASAVQPLPANNSSSLTAPTLEFSLQIFCGLTQQKCFIPLDCLTKPLRLRCYLNPYAKAFLDASFGINKDTLEANSTVNDITLSLCQPARPQNPTAAPPLGVSTTMSNFGTQTSGTYQLTNLQLVYDRITLAPETRAQINAVINSAEGLLFHIQSWLTSEEQVLGGIKATIDLTEVCRSLKAVFPCFYANGEELDSYQMAMPWLPGFQDYQYKLGTNYYPDYKIQSDLQARDAFFNAIGLENSGWSQSCTTAWSCTPPSALVIGGAGNNALQGTVFPAFMDPLQKSANHNDFFQNQLILEASNSVTSFSIPATALPGGVPTGWGYGYITLNASSTTYTITATAAGPPAVQVYGSISGIGDANHTVILLSTGLASGAYASTQNTGVFVSSVTSGTNFIIGAAASDTRTIGFVWFPKPNKQAASQLTIGQPLDNSGNGYWREGANPGSLFVTPFATATTGYNVVPALVRNYEMLAYNLSTGQGTGPATQEFFYGANQQTNVGMGPYVFNQTFLPSDWTQTTTGFTCVVAPPVDNGAATNTPFPLTAQIFVTPQPSPNLNGGNGDWQSLMAVSINGSTGVATLYLPNFALRTTNPASSLPAIFSFMVVDTSLFSTTSDQASLQDAANGPNAKFRYLNPNDSATAGYSQYTARRGPWPLQWHSGSFDYFASVAAASGSNYTSYGMWNRGIFVPAWCFETDRHEHTPSGLNTNIPAKRLQFLLSRSSTGANNYNWVNAWGLGGAVGGNNQNGTNGIAYLNQGGIPQLQVRFFFLHDRFFYIKYGLITDVTW